MSLWKVARDRGNQIARELKLRKSAEVVHPEQQRAFGSAMIEMVRTPGAPARARINELYQRVPRRRELQTAVALLDLAWRIPPETRLEEDVVWMIRRCYLDAPREGWRLRIRDELRDRQVHPFPNVRRVVRLVRQIDAADDGEIAELKDLQRGYPDLRQSIAERIILRNQVDYLDAVISYLANALEGGCPDPEEEKAARRLFLQIAAAFQKDARALAILYREYLARYDSQESRGFLMLALANFGDVIVPQLELDHAANPQDRGPIEHILMRMVMKGGLAATETLLTILRDAQSPQVSQTAKFLSKALATLAGYGEHGQGAAAVRETVNKALPILDRRPLPEIRGFIDSFIRLEWGQANVDTLIDSVLDGSAGDAQRQQLRRLARAASQRLVTIAQDPEHSSVARCRALETLALLHATATPEMASRLWSIFSGTESDDVRLSVVCALGALELDPGPQARDCLFGLIQSGSPKLSEAIRDTWSRIFRAVSLTDGSTRDGVKT